MNLEQRNKLNDRIKSLYSIYQQKIAYAISSEEEPYEELIAILYEFFQRVYKLILESIKRTEPEISKVDLSKLFYNKDGKSLEQRVREHCEEFYFSEKTTADKISLLDKISKIANTEAHNITNTVMYYKLRDKAKFIVIYGCEDCEDCVEYHGTYPIEEFDGTLPPFHPDCECSCYMIVEKE